MPEPGLNSPEAARLYEWGPAFDDLASDLTPDQKHRYTQLRAAMRRQDTTPTNDPAERRRRGQETSSLYAMFTKPNSDEDVLFQMLEEGETEAQAKNRTPFGKEFGSKYASPGAAHRRKNSKSVEPAEPTQQPQEGWGSGYNDLNSRYVGISERTFLAPPNNNRAKAAKALLKSGK